MADDQFPYFAMLEADINVRGTNRSPPHLACEGLTEGLKFNRLTMRTDPSIERSVSRGINPGSQKPTRQASGRWLDSGFCGACVARQCTLSRPQIIRGTGSYTQLNLLKGVKNGCGEKNGSSVVLGHATAACGLAGERRLGHHGEK